MKRLLKKLASERRHQKQDEIIDELEAMIEKDKEEIEEKRWFEDLVEEEYHEVIGKIIDHVRKTGETTFVVKYGSSAGFPEKIDQILSAVAKKLEKNGITCSAHEKYKDRPIQMRVFHISI